LRIKNQDNDFGYVGGTLRSLQGNLPPTISPQAAELSHGSVFCWLSSLKRFYWSV